MHGVTAVLCDCVLTVSTTSFLPSFLYITLVVSLLPIVVLLSPVPPPLPVSSLCLSSSSLDIICFTLFVLTVLSLYVTKDDWQGLLCVLMQTLL